MLVVTRKQGESIQIGDDISVMVVRCASPVRIGVEAPADINVDRTETLGAKSARRAARTQTGQDAPSLLDKARDRIAGKYRSIPSMRVRTSPLTVLSTAPVNSEQWSQALHAVQLDAKLKLIDELEGK